MKALDNIHFFLFADSAFSVCLDTYFYRLVRINEIIHFQRTLYAKLMDSLEESKY